MITSADILNARILVVDDKAVNVTLILGMLRVAGYTCVEATGDPRAVCELYRQNRYDLILLDLQMPDMDGFEVMEALQTIEGSGYLPVLVVTAQPSHKLRALEAGAKDFVGKPFDMAELRARVHNILEVRLLHKESLLHSEALEKTIRELETSRDAIRANLLADQKRDELELQLAQETQESLLPRVLPAFENFHLYAYSNPTRYVGGDFYDFRQLDTGEWAGVLADVSGKGMAAALLSSMALGALSMEFRSGARPKELLHRVNQLLCDKSLSSQFITLFLFFLNEGGEGHFVGAGHNPACLFRASTGKIEKLNSESYILGMFDFACYEPRAFHMSSGDVLVVYSDGLTDAENGQEEEFGEARLRKLILKEAPAGGAVLKQKLLEALEGFTEGTVQTDDITFVIVEKFQ